MQREEIIEDTLNAHEEDAHGHVTPGREHLLFWAHVVPQALDDESLNLIQPLSRTFVCACPS
jgi:hypothetical protein